MTRMLVVGGTGLLGSRVVEAARRDFDVTMTHRGRLRAVPGIRSVEMHKEFAEPSAAALADARPEVVVDVAAFHNVDRCEEDRETARRVNVDGTANLAQAAAQAGARFVYVSTDYVFDGTGGPYREGDLPAPVNYYGETKVLAERATLAASPENLVVRPSVVYGWEDSRLNFATWVLTTVREGKTASVVTDWYASPTFADSLAEAIVALASVTEGGVYHLAGPDCMNRHEFARRLVRAFDLDEGLLRPVRGADLKMRATRPERTCLRNERAARVGIETIGVDEAIRVMASQRALSDFATPTAFKT